MPHVPHDWHLRDAHEVLTIHDVDPATGLTDPQVRERAIRHGPNALPDGASRSVAALVLEQLTDVMILVLAAAAVVSGVLGDWVDTAVILVIVVLNAGIGVLQAWRADRALAALRGLSAAHAMVLRDGVIRKVEAHGLVPGDLVLLEAGCQVPADLRLLTSTQLRIDESTLTGESVTVAKHAQRLTGEAHALGDRLNMAYKGTHATHGQGRGVVVATGTHTELGRVAGLLQGAGFEPTPLQRRLALFGRKLALVVLAICAIVFLGGLARGEPPLLMLMTAVSLAVAAIPEALPAVVTVLLALGARRMVLQQALVRRLPAVEALGSVTFICSDKTGTLTLNRMRAEWLVASSGERWTAESPAAGVDSAALNELLRALALCNDASAAPSGGWSGDPTETALLDLAAAGGLDVGELREAWPRRGEQPFAAETQRMATLHEGPLGLTLYAKGAPEALLPLCAMDAQPGGTGALDRDAWLARAGALAAEGLRVLAVARLSQVEGDAQRAIDEGLESAGGLVFLGQVGLIDPPRPEAAAAVAECLAAGITPAMITGDHPATALAIARRLGIASEGSRVITGAALAAMDDAALAACVREVRVFARVDPAQKIRIVSALQAQGELVAMTGDGVNDAPALRKADIGVAMGLGGTDVAREASSLVLMDDHFATIVGAVREGRRIYDNIRKFVRYAMTGNSGEIWLIFLAPFLGLPIPLLPIHILWVNLVTDGLPGLALAAEPAEPGVMARPPRAPDESLFAGGLWQHALAVGLLLAGVCLGVQAWAVATGEAHGQTMVFTILTLGQMAHVLAIRSETQHLWTQGLSSNRPLLGAVALTLALQLAIIYLPALNAVFHTQPLGAGELALCFGAAAVIGLAVEAEKAWRLRHAPGGAGGELATR